MNTARMGFSVSCGEFLPSKVATSLNVGGSKMTWRHKKGRSGVAEQTRLVTGRSIGAAM